VSDRKPSGSEAKQGLALLAMVAFAAICCAALPPLAVLAGGIAIGALVGIGAGLVATVGLVALVVLRRRSGRRP
jgi:uncharacterized membrane protein